MSVLKFEGPCYNILRKNSFTTWLLFTEGAMWVGGGGTGMVKGGG